MISVEDDRNEKEDYVERSLFMRFLINRKNEASRQKYLSKMKAYLRGLNNKKANCILESMAINLAFVPGGANCEDELVF